MNVVFGLMIIKQQQTSSSLTTHGDLSQLINTRRTLPSLGWPRLISDIDNSDLIHLPNLKEVKQAIYSIDFNRTSGPNGFGVGFFKHYQKII